ncbi:hypothetical protein ACL9RF_14155 [Sphingobacterium sp. Mn56C]|uniref:hypothetical protein n=1 Tax=Sphingobacterium sp. Mn56C TaxID=3395261 RepID=UPI003BCA8B2B
MNKILLFRYGTIVLLFLIQIFFLLAIFKENTNSYLVLVFIISVVLLTLYTYRWSTDLHHDVHEFESYKIAAWVPVGAVCSYYLNQRLGLGPVLGASIVGTVASFIPQLHKKSDYLINLPTPLYCGAFIGMSSTRVASDFTFVLVASFFTAVLLIVSKSLLKGVGGKLGTLAFLGVAITYFLIYLLK